MSLKQIVVIACSSIFVGIAVCACIGAVCRRRMRRFHNDGVYYYELENSAGEWAMLSGVMVRFGTVCTQAG